MERETEGVLMKWKGLIIGIAAILMLCFLVISATVGIVYLRIEEIKDRQDHLYIIDMEITSEDETGYDMIEVSENLDYEKLFEMSPRDDGRAMMMKPAEGRANYIFRENIDYYSDHIEELREDHTFGQYKLKYTVNAERSNWAKLRIQANRDTDPTPSGLYTPERRISLFGCILDSEIIYFNGSELDKVDISSGYYEEESLEILYEDCYLIEMFLDYSAKPEPKEGGGFEMYQYIVLNKEAELMVAFRSRIDFGVLDGIDTPW